MAQDLAEVARLTDPSFYAGDPHPVYARLRREAPVFWSADGQSWALSWYEDVHRVGYDTTLFSSRRGTLLTDGVARDAGELPGEPLTELELPTYCKFLLVAGTVTTRNLISSGIALPSESPDQRRLLIGSPELPPGAVEEMLRVVSPVLAFCRTATADTEIRGQHIAAGGYVALLYASANRDEDIWPDPDRFELTRPQPRPHVAFGFGAHVCLGANLARVEARVLFEELLRAFPDFQVTGPAVRGASTLVAIVEQLPAVFGSRAQARAGV